MPPVPIHLLPPRVALFLLFQALLEGLDELFQPAQRLDPGFLFIGELFLEFAAQPLVGNQRFDGGVHVLDALEPGGKGAIEAVEVALILHHDRARDLIERLHIGKHHAALHHRVKV